MVAAAVFFGGKNEAPPVSNPVVETKPQIVSPALIDRPPEAPQTNNAAMALATAAMTEAQEQARTEFVQNRISELNDLAMSEDPASLNQILGELDNPEPRIRSAAVDAAVQFKSAEAIPALRDAEQQATDTEEKMKIHQAIEFLSLTAQSQATNANP